MILFLFFIFFLLLENLFLPALVGPQNFLISPLFLAGLIIYAKNIKIKFIQAAIFLLFWEVFSGFRIGSLVIPFVITAGLYIWINNFLEISSGLRESDTFLAFVGGVVTMVTFVYINSWFFLFFNSSYDAMTALNELITLLTNSIFQTMGWSAGFVVLFKYALRPK